MEWRTNPLPYYVWVSEIMLQQTRVETVRPYFHRFVNELPDIASLAQCDEERLLKLWEGLGYYNRVRNMQKAARIVMEEYGGELPPGSGASSKSFPASAPIRQGRSHLPPMGSRLPRWTVMFSESCHG